MGLWAKQLADILRDQKTIRDAGFEDAAAKMDDSIGHLANKIRFVLPHPDEDEAIEEPTGEIVEPPIGPDEDA